MEKKIIFPLRHLALQKLFWAQLPSTSLPEIENLHIFTAPPPRPWIATHAQVLLDEIQGEGTSVIVSSSSLPPPAAAAVHPHSEAKVPLDRNRLTLRPFWSVTHEMFHGAHPAIWDGEHPCAGVSVGGDNPPPPPFTKNGTSPPTSPQPTPLLLLLLPWRKRELPEKKKKGGGGVGGASSSWATVSIWVFPWHLRDLGPWLLKRQCCSCDYGGHWGAEGCDAALSLFSAPGAVRVIRQD